MKKKPVRKTKKKERISKKKEREIINEILSESKPKEIERMILECTDKIKNYLLHGWWIVSKPIENEYDENIYSRIIKNELVVLERNTGIKIDSVVPAPCKTMSGLERINRETLDDVPFIEPPLMDMYD